MTVKARPSRAPVTKSARKPMNIRSLTPAEIVPDRDPTYIADPFLMSEPPPGVVPRAMDGAKLAMDWAGDITATYSWAIQGAFREGIGFLGYPYLAQLTQRPEYRRISEIIALEMTRKWVKVTAKGDSKSPKVGEMEDALKTFNIQALFRHASELDGFFGRGQIFIDTGKALDSDTLSQPLILDPRTVEQGSLKGFRCVEPYWSYPSAFNSNDPLAPNFYQPQVWYVNGTQVHVSRLLTFVSRELPDILKPSYVFGGLSMSQMAKPYVDNWLRTRQSVSDLIHSFSTMVLSTDLSSILMDGAGANQLIHRAQLFTQTRDNRGLMMVNLGTEELTNVSTPLSGLDALQAQSQEQMASVAGIPLVILLGITPSGLNASSDGEIQVFYAKIAADQEALFRPRLQIVFDLIQLHLWGEIDPDLGFEFNSLWEEDEEDLAANRKTQADTDAVYVQMGAVAPEEVRERLASDDSSPYHGLDLNKVIEPPVDPALEGDPDNEDDAEEEAASGA